MLSKYSQLLLALQSRLATILNYIELDLGQLETYEQRPPVAFPCGLIAFSTTFQMRQIKSQVGDVKMVLKLGFDTFANTANLMPLSEREKALQYLEVEQLVYLQLQNWYADGLLIIPFRRVSDADQYSEDGLRKRLITFSAQFADDTLAELGE